MLKLTNQIAIALIILTLFSSCDQVSSILERIGIKEQPSNLALIEFGEIEHYKSFLWKEGNTPEVSTALILDFNLAAIQENGAVTLQLQDNTGKAVTLESHKAQLFINRIGHPNGTHTLTAQQLAGSKELDISIKFNDGAAEGIHEGFISVINSNLDRINDIQLSSAQSTNNSRILQWQAQYTPVINPLKFWLLLVSVVLLFLLFLRLTFLKKRLYPVFSGTIRYLESPSQSKSINFNGHRQVILTNRVPKQSTFDRLWRGKILYINDPLFTAPVEFTPRKKGAIKYRLDTNKYAVSPSDGFLQRGIEYKIKSTESKQTVILK